jgi:hypothetical protein
MQGKAISFFISFAEKQITIVNVFFLDLLYRRLVKIYNSGMKTAQGVLQATRYELFSRHLN